MSKRQRVDVLSGGVQVVGELKTRNENMLGLWKAAALCDVKLSVGERTFDAHKIVLASGSDMLRAMFAGPCSTMSDSQAASIELHEVSADALGHALEFLYAGRVGLPEADALLPLLQAAHMLGMADLIEATCVGIIRQLDVLDASVVWQLAETLALPKVQEEVQRYVYQRFPSAEKADHVRAGRLAVEELAGARSIERYLLDLSPEAVSAREDKAAGFTADQMRTAGHSSYACKAVGFSAKELLRAGHLSSDGYHASVFSAEEAAAAGFTIKEMKAAGYLPYECKEAGFTIEEMKAAGYLPYECKVAGFSFEEAARAGFDTWGPERSDFWFSTGRYTTDSSSSRYTGGGLAEIGRRFGW